MTYISDFGCEKKKKCTAIERFSQGVVGSKEDGSDEIACALGIELDVGTSCKVECDVSRGYESNEGPNEGSYRCPPEGGTANPPKLSCFEIDSQSSTPGIVIGQQAAHLSKRSRENRGHDVPRRMVPIDVTINPPRCACCRSPSCDCCDRKEGASKLLALMKHIGELQEVLALPAEI